MLEKDDSGEEGRLDLYFDSPVISSLSCISMRSLNSVNSGSFRVENGTAFFTQINRSRLMLISCVFLLSVDPLRYRSRTVLKIAAQNSYNVDRLRDAAI